ncbi:Oxidoreductase [Dispira simplex]|nr:Oxidoreductase [Dispira simplex]
MAEDKDTVSFVTQEERDTTPLVPIESSELNASTESSEATTPPPQAYDPTTGKINWDCPCLGGMANSGPCAEEFRASFSCFATSTAEPQGSDCVDKFMAMQTCFSDHPEEYADMLADDDDDDVIGENDEKKEEDKSVALDTTIDQDSDQTIYPGK